MKPFRSLRLRITLLCALLLTLCCAALAVTSNLSAIHLTDTIAAAPLSPALDPEAAAKGTMPLLTTGSSSGPAGPAAISDPEYSGLYRNPGDGTSIDLPAGGPGSCAAERPE